MHTLLPILENHSLISHTRTGDTAPPLPLYTILIVVGLIILPPPPTLAQVGFPGVPEGPSTNVRIYPTDFWGPRVGPGVGVGLVAHNLTRPHDQWLLTAAPAQHEQIATLSFASANPQRARRYILLDTRFLHTDRDWFGAPDDRLTLERVSIRGRVRLGQTFFDHRLLLQPHLSLTSHHITGVRGNSTPSQGTTGPQSISISGTPQTGIRTGLDVRFDTRNRPVSATRGLLLQGTWDRYVPLDGFRLRFDQVDLDAYGFVPFGGLHRLVLRASATVTAPRTEVAVPIYMRPTLGGTVVPGWARGRFVDRDRLLGSILYRFPLWSFGEVATIEGHLGGHLGNVYRDLGKQFTPTIDTDETISATEKPPLRPTASIGLRFAAPVRNYAVFDLALGVSPEGVSAVQFSVIRRLQSIRPPHHSSDPIR